MDLSLPLSVEVCFILGNSMFMLCDKEAGVMFGTNKLQALVVLRVATRNNFDQCNVVVMIVLLSVTLTCNCVRAEAETNQWD